MQLTDPHVRTIFDHPSGTPFDGYPVLQVVQIKPLQEGARYRVVLSDMDYFVQSMLTGDLKDLVSSGTLQRGHLVRIIEHNKQIVGGSKRILVIEKLEVLSQYGTLEKLGQPVGLDKFIESTKSDQPQAITGNQFYGAPQPAPKAPMQTFNRDVSDRHGNISPIESLSPYSHKWTIRARVTQRSAIRTWHNNNGEGRLFSVNLLDESGEIRATAFHSIGDPKFDDLYNQLQEGKVFYISTPCLIKLANKKFNNLKNDYEITFEKDTQVETAKDQSNVPQQKYHFTSIEDLQNVMKDTTVDCLGVLKESGEVNEIMSKTTNRPYSKREVTLVDQTRHQVRLTLWGDSALNFNVPLESVIAFKGAKVSDFGGRSLSLLSSGTMVAAPDIEEAHKLQGWYDREGRNEEFASHTSAMGSGGGGRVENIKTIAEVKDEGLGQNTEPDNFAIKATVQYIKDNNMSYPACRSEKCNRKVTEDHSGQWECQMCNKTWDRPEYRYVLSVNVADHTGQLWLSLFDDSGRVVMGKTADEMSEFTQNSDDSAVKGIIEDATSKTYVFNCRAKLDTYNEEAR